MRFNYIFIYDRSARTAFFGLKRISLAALNSSDNRLKSDFVSTIYQSRIGFDMRILIVVKICGRLFLIPNCCKAPLN